MQLAQVATPSSPPQENLRWLEHQLDVTYSAACCYHNAGTATLLVRLPSAMLWEDQADDASTSGRTERRRSCGGLAEQRLVDIFGRRHEGEAYAWHCGQAHSGVASVLGTVCGASNKTPGAAAATLPGTLSSSVIHSGLALAENGLKPKQPEARIVQPKVVSAPVGAAVNAGGGLSCKFRGLAGRRGTAADQTDIGREDVVGSQSVRGSAPYGRGLLPWRQRLPSLRMALRHRRAPSAKLGDAESVELRLAKGAPAQVGVRVGVALCGS